MLVSVAAYSLIWGWKFAAGFVVLLLVHEMGHVIQLRREGVPASAPLFIPFLGAAVGMKRMPAAGSDTIAVSGCWTSAATDTTCRPLSRARSTSGSYDTARSTLPAASVGTGSSPFREDTGASR